MNLNGPINVDYIDFINQRIIRAHNLHYVNGRNTLIDISKNASPNENHIYHLYSNGEITYQKGAWAYGQRSEFNCAYEISGARNIQFKFVNEAADGTTYAILTKEQCFYFREWMKKYVEKNK